MRFAHANRLFSFLFWLLCSILLCPLVAYADWPLWSGGKATTPKTRDSAGNLV